MAGEATGTKPSEGAPAIDLEKFVPKEEYQKLNQTVESLKKTLEEEKLKLLDPGYIEYLESKRTKTVTQSDVDKAKAAGLPKEAVDYIEELKGRLVRTESILSNVTAILELQQAEKQFPDFNNYREDIQKILEADKAGVITYAQAYYQAKGSKGAAPAAPANPAGDTPLKGGERPGQYIPPTGTQKEFKNAYEAGQDAVNQIKTKYNIVGDII